MYHFDAADSLWMTRISCSVHAGICGSLFAFTAFFPCHFTGRSPMTSSPSVSVTHTMLTLAHTTNCMSVLHADKLPHGCKRTRTRVGSRAWKPCAEQPALLPWPSQVGSQLSVENPSLQCLTVLLRHCRHPSNTLQRSSNRSPSRPHDDRQRSRFYHACVKQRGSQQHHSQTRQVYRTLCMTQQSIQDM